MMSAREQFAAIVAPERPDETIDLAMAALAIAAEEYPQLRPEPYIQRLDYLAERVRDHLGDETAAPVVLGELSRLLFEEEGFRGNAEAYYDPRNSYLNDVLDRRLGIPLTLGIIYLETGWRLGLSLYGVNFPGHFMIRYEGEALRLLIDPYHAGLIRFEDQAQELLDRVYGGSVKLQEEYLRTATRRDILVRLLSNLKTIHMNARDDARALAAVERILLVRPAAAEEVRDLGMLLARLARVDEAITALEHYLHIAPAALDVTRIQILIDELKK